MKYRELTQEARDAWLSDEVTKAAMEWLRERHRQTVDALISRARTGDTDAIRYIVGKMDEADTIIQFLERGK